MAKINDRGARFSHLLSLELKGAIGAHGRSVRSVSADIGVHHTTMSGYFNGSRMLPADTFNDACESIGVTPALLVERAYDRLLSEFGPYGQKPDAEIVSLYTPRGGIPLDAASKRTGRNPRSEEVQ